MNVATERFGVIDVPRKDVFELSTPLLGIPDTTSFFFMQEESIAPFFWIQSVDDPEMTLIVVEPHHFFRHYSPRLQLSDLKDVGASHPGEVRIFAIVVLPDDMSKMTANLRRPLIVNFRTGKMKQVRRSFREYSFEESIVEGIKRSETARADVGDRFEVSLN